MDPGQLSDWYLGYEVVLKTLKEQKISGTVWAFDKAIDTVVIASPAESGQPGSSTIRVLKVSFIKEIESAVAPATPFDQTLPAFDQSRLEKREERLIKRAEAEIAAIGVGVTAEAQAVFDALYKTMECKWDGTKIVVMEEVVITEPYTVADCTLKSENGNDNVLERVTHVLGAEREQLGKSR